MKVVEEILVSAIVDGRLCSEMDVQGGLSSYMARWFEAREEVRSSSNS